ncbi:hypothetical protein PR048_000402 [Dryococelus australis]|uniref:Uncharacterized protein n=1 Tax=Dryococelus australis TaxID=614101 RepID=A0ABQ9IEI0_9NEOP|nr:hypothetical protein PR048_000402 [Dryococelus australis]
MIPTCENPGATLPRIESGSSRWEASSLPTLLAIPAIFQFPRPTVVCHPASRLILRTPFHHTAVSYNSPPDEGGLASETVHWRNVRRCYRQVILTCTVHSKIPRSCRIIPPPQNCTVGRAAVPSNLATLVPQRGKGGQHPAYSKLQPNISNDSASSASLNFQPHTAEAITPHTPRLRAPTRDKMMYLKHKGAIDADFMKKVIVAVTGEPDKRISIRELANNVKLAILLRHLKAFENSGECFCYCVNYDVKRAFPEAEEQSRVQYVQTVAKNASWNDEQIAGDEWLRGFMRMHADQLALRKLEAKEFGIWMKLACQLIVASKGVKQIGSCTSAERGTLVTMVAAINAVGNHISPLLIFPRVNFKSRMISGAPLGMIGVATPAGWSNNEMFVIFLHHFITFVKCSKDEHFLTTMKNTFLSKLLKRLLMQALWWLLPPPPPPQHKLQPVDMTVIGPHKTFYNQAVDAWHVNHPGTTFYIYCVPKVLRIAFPYAFSMLAKSAGIFPLDPGVFSVDDFLASYVTDRNPEVMRVAAASLPVSFKPEKYNISQGLASSSDQPETSTAPQNISTTSSSEKVGLGVSPEQIQPYPKAKLRKVTNKGRKSDRTRIMTDTPEKEEIRKIKGRKRMKCKLAARKNHCCNS